MPPPPPPSITSRTSQQMSQTSSDARLPQPAAGTAAAAATAGTAVAGAAAGAAGAGGYSPPPWAVSPPTGAQLQVYKDGSIIQEIPLTQVTAGATQLLLHPMIFQSKHALGPAYQGGTETARWSTSVPFVIRCNPCSVGLRSGIWDWDLVKAKCGRNR